MKIIALRLIKPESHQIFDQQRHNNIAKGLLEENENSRIFRFYNNYELQDDDWFKETRKDPFSDCFDDPIRADNKLKINVCAIVGKNGSGKSSVIELIIRLINNFACSIIGDEKPFNAAERLHFIPDVFANLYFEIKDTQYRLEQRGNNIYMFSTKDQGSFYENNYDPINYRWTELDYIQALNISPLKDFFYTVIVNYSHYSYNIYDFKNEWDIETSTKKLEEKGILLNDIRDIDYCWLTGVFHKNDGYQTPIVLNPFRTDGYYIDTQRESELEEDRFLSIVLALNKGQEQQSIFDNVIDNKHIDSFSIRSKKSGKLNFYKSQCKKLNINFDSTVYRPILKYWTDHYPIQEDKIHNSSLHKQAIEYLIYKTLKIGFQYKKFSWDDFMKFNEDTALLYNTITLFIGDNSHITYKLKQTISFLINNHITNTDYISLLDLSSMIESQVKYVNDILEDYIERGRIENPISHTNPQYIFSEIDCLPPPIFDVEIFLKTKDSSEEPYNFKTLSSGEKQMIYMTSSVLYHINNINSVQYRSKYSSDVPYKHINIILEEIELYYHPEMQRKLVNYLLEQIASLKIEIASIQIMLVTHSPFVLSDIPRNNILYLTKDDSDTKIEESFGENIFSLLQNSFFLEKGPIGDHSYKIINNLFEIVSNPRSNNGIKKEKLMSLINSVGEEFLRSELKRFFNDEDYVEN